MLSGTGNAMLVMVVKISKKLQLVLWNLPPGPQNALPRAKTKISMTLFRTDVCLIADN